MRNYSPRTVRAYISCVKKFWEYVDKRMEFFDDQHIEDFLLSLYQKKYAPKTVNLYYNAIKSFAQEILKYRVTLRIDRTKRVKRLPRVLSR
ncbi:MAG: site-specific integrase [bacterium]|nr:site-specific integrase [bacterium]